MSFAAKYEFDATLNTEKEHNHFLLRIDPWNTAQPVMQSYFHEQHHIANYVANHIANHIVTCILRGLNRAVGWHSESLGHKQCGYNGKSSNSNTLFQREDKWTTQRYNCSDSADDYNQNAPMRHKLHIVVSNIGDAAMFLLSLHTFSFHISAICSDAATSFSTIYEYNAATNTEKQCWSILSPIPSLICCRTGRCNPHCIEQNHIVSGRERERERVSPAITQTLTQSEWAPPSRSLSSTQHIFVYNAVTYCRCTSCSWMWPSFFVWAHSWFDLGILLEFKSQIISAMISTHHTGNADHSRCLYPRCTYHTPLYEYKARILTSTSCRQSKCSWLVGHRGGTLSVSSGSVVVDCSLSRSSRKQRLWNANRVSGYIHCGNGSSARICTADSCCTMCKSRLVANRAQLTCNNLQHEPCLACKRLFSQTLEI